MSVIVTDNGFSPAGAADFVTLDDPALGTAQAVELGHDADPAALAPHLDRIALIRVTFPAFSDGRGFTVARRLRLLGYKGRLRAAGHLIADQYAMIRRAGFDEAEISDDLAARQPEAQWLFRADWRAHDYQSRLRA